MPFEPKPGDQQRLTGLIKERGEPLNKATYLEALVDYELPDFPLHGELLALIPADLPGKMPEDAAELVAMLLAPLRDSSKTSTRSPATSATTST